jgi:hypothetical protein
VRSVTTGDAISLFAEMPVEMVPVVVMVVAVMTMVVAVKTPSGFRAAFVALVFCEGAGWQGYRGEDSD